MPEKQAKLARDRLEESFHDELARRDVDGILVQSHLTTVAVVGLGMAGAPGIAAQAFAALATSDINVIAIAQGSSELNISIVVPSSQSALALKKIHEAFRLGD